MEATTVPVTVTPEAAELVAEFGLQRELAQTIEHGRQTVLGLRSLRVVVMPGSESEPEDYLLIHAELEPEDFAGPDRHAWRDWHYETFPLPVCERIRILRTPEASHGR